MPRKKKINFFFKERVKKEEERSTKTEKEINKKIKVKDGSNNVIKIIINN